MAHTVNPCFNSLPEDVENLRKKSKAIFDQGYSQREADIRALQELQDEVVGKLDDIHKQLGISSPKTESDGKTEKTKVSQAEGRKEGDDVTKNVSGDRLTGKAIFTDFNSTIADAEGKLLPFGEEIVGRIKDGEPITIVTKSGSEGDAANEKRMLDAMGLKEKPENLTIHQGVSPEEKVELAKKGVLVDNSATVLSEAEKGKVEAVNANELNKPKISVVPEVKKPIVVPLKTKQNAEEIRSDQGQVHPEGGSDAILQDKGSEDIQQPEEKRPKASDEKKPVEFTTKSGRQKVIERDGKLVVVNKDGKEVSPETRRNALKEYADQYDFSIGDKAPDPEGIVFRSEDEAKQWYIDNTNNPTELAAIFANEELVDAPLSGIEHMISEYGGLKTTESSYAQFGDRNNINNALARSYFGSEKEGPNQGLPLDVIAKEMSDHYDTEITPYDLVDFMDRFKQGSIGAPKESDIAIQAKEKFKQLTGLDLTHDLAGKVIDREFETLDKLNQDLLNDEYETEQQLDERHAEATTKNERDKKEGKADTSKQSGGEGDTGGKEPPKEPGERITKENPKEEWTSVRKEKNAEIKGAKELFEQQKTIPWDETYSNGLSNVQAMYPDKNLYDAMKARVNYFVGQLENKILFNPTSEDNAVFNVFKNQTIDRMGKIGGWESNDEIVRQNAQLEYESLKGDLFNVVRVTNPGGEAGRAFNILQSEIFNDPDHGLQIRRMELQGAKGDKLSEDDMEFTANQWEEEKARMRKEQELNEKMMKDRFEKEIDKIKKAKPKTERPPTSKESKKEKREKLLSQSGKDLAEKIRAGKLKGTFASFPGLPQAINAVIEGIAKLVEGGYTLAEAIKNYVSANGIRDEQKFTDDLFNIFEKQEKMGESLDKIAQMANDAGINTLNNEMVAKNLIRDYVNSHIGLHDQKDILDQAYKGLKEVLPELDRSKFIEAYLKENEFRQPTSDQLKKGEALAKRQLTSIAKLEEDIADLKNYKEQRQRSFRTERERSIYEKSLIAEKEGIIKERQERKSQADREYRELETERNRQLRRVSELMDKKEKLEKGIREKKKVTPKVDTPEIENLKKQVAEADKNLRDAEKEVRRINREADAKTAKIAQYNIDIQRVKMGLDLQKRGKSKPITEVDKDIAAKEKQLNDEMNKMGVKVARDDKYQKASYSQRAETHNTRLDDLSKSIQKKLDGELPEDVRKQLLKLKGQIDASKIKLDPHSALSQERTLKAGIDLLKGVKNEFSKTAGEHTQHINKELQKIIDGFNSDKEQSIQDMKLARAKDKARRDEAEFTRKLAAGEFEDEQPIDLTKTDAEYIRLDRERRLAAEKFYQKKREYQKKNQKWYEKGANLVKSLLINSLIYRLSTMEKIAFSGTTRPLLFEPLTRLTSGKIFEALPFETTKAITQRAKLGGETTSLKAIKKSYQAIFSKFGPDKLKKIYQESSDKFEKLDAEYQKEKNRAANIPLYDDKEVLQDLKNKRDEALKDAIGNVVYQFIGGSSWKEAAEVFLHRASSLEMELGNFQREGWDPKGTIADNLEYLLNFVGRSHALLKNFSARASFASGFMARLEGSMEDGSFSTSPDKLLEMAHESYFDWEQGKYQQSNWLSDKWADLTNGIERKHPEVAYLMRTDVAITRVPVNMIREAVMEYTLGAINGSRMAWKEYNKARGKVVNDGITPEMEEEFGKALKEQLGKIDATTAATIVRSFRKGGFGLGLFALALLMKTSFGGWPHKGQAAEEKKRKQRDQALGIPEEIKTGEIRLGDYKVPEDFGKIIEHTPAFEPMGFGLGMYQVYRNNIIDGKATPESIYDASMSQVNHILSNLPQIEHFAKPLAGGIADRYDAGAWNDVDSAGNTIKRHAFNVDDYITHIFNKKGTLSEPYYKEAVKNQKYYRDQIMQVELNVTIPPKQKEELRDSLLKQLKESTDEIYRQNKENPR